MAGTDKQKQSLYFPEETLREIVREALRLDRSLSWTVQQAWRIAREEIKKFPSVDRRGDAAPVSSARARPPDPARQVIDFDRLQPSEQVREFLRGKFDRELAS